MITVLAFALLAALGCLQLGLDPHPWQPAKSLHQAGTLLVAGLTYASYRFIPTTRTTFWVLVALLAPVAAWTWIDPRGPFSYAGTAAACCLGLAALAGHLGAPAGPWLAMLSGAGVWASGSRAAALAGLVALAPVFVARVRVPYLAAGGSLVSSALFLGFPGISDPPGRWEHWRRALSRAEYAPWFGTGLMSEHPELAHNDWLQMRADLGLVGLVLLLLAVGSALWAMRRSRAPWLVAGAVALVCQSVVDFPLTHPATLILFVALAGSAAAFTPEVKTNAA